MGDPIPLYVQFPIHLLSVFRFPSVFPGYLHSLRLPPPFHVLIHSLLPLLLEVLLCPLLSSSQELPARISFSLCLAYPLTLLQSNSSVEFLDCTRGTRRCALQRRHLSVRLGLSFDYQRANTTFLVMLRARLWNENVGACGEDQHLGLSTRSNLNKSPSLSITMSLQPRLRAQTTPTTVPDDFLATQTTGVAQPPLNSAR